LLALEGPIRVTARDWVPCDFSWFSSVMSDKCQNAKKSPFHISLGDNEIEH